MAVLWVTCWSYTALAAEVGLVTSLAGKVQLQEELARTAFPIKSFIKIREGDRLTLDPGARVQLVYFRGGTQETWSGAGAIEVGLESSTVTKGGLQPETRKLSAILVKQLSKTPENEGNVKTGMVRMRSTPPGGSIDATEKIYSELRAQAAETDLSPELFLLASYNEAREFERMGAFLSRIESQAKNDPELQSLVAMYRSVLSGIGPK